MPNVITKDWVEWVGSIQTHWLRHGVPWPVHHTIRIVQHTTYSDSQQPVDAGDDLNDELTITLTTTSYDV